MRQGLARCVAAGVAVLLAAAMVCAAQEGKEPAPKVSDKPLTAEQLSVYRAVLAEWAEHELTSINLAVETEPLDADGPFGYGECAKGLKLEALAKGEAPVVHRFTAEDLPKLSKASIRLVDPEQGRKDVEENDPERGMRKGKSVDESVRNGFAHGLFTLSEVRFDKEHKHAVVSFSFVCGGLCGNGQTMVLEKVEGGWQPGRRCHDWVS